MEFRSTKLLYGEQYQQLTGLAVLVVGVGGIGCEVLKCFSRLPVRQLDIIDLDTIETSNFNRQFLFRKEHTGHSKALTARETLLKMNPDLPINAHHCAVQEKTVDFFRQFQLVVLALDNFQARTYVNQVCVVLELPLVDAGTTGFLGQVQFTHPYHTACYTCENIERKKETVFAVCTIRRRPEKPIHCIVWAKFVFEMLFGPPNSDNEMTDLQVYSVEVRKPKESTMSELCRFLFYDNVVDRMSQAQEGQVDIIDKEILQERANEIEGFFDNLSTSQLSEIPVLKGCLIMFQQSLIALMQRIQAGGVLTFEKDDEHIMAFVASAANIRMLTYRIKPLSFYSIKSMAGNIIPAIASTNSIVSGLEVTESYKFFTGERNKMKKVWVKNQDAKLTGEKIVKPRGNCAVCSKPFRPVIIQFDFQTATLRSIVDLIRTEVPDLEEFSINDDNKNELYCSGAEEDSKLLDKPIVSWTKNKVVQLTLMNDDTFDSICGLFVADSQHPLTANLQMLQQKSMIVKQAEAAKDTHETKFAVKEVNGKVQFELESESESSDLEIVMLPPPPKRPNVNSVEEIDEQCNGGESKKRLKTD